MPLLDCLKLDKSQEAEDFDSPAVTEKRKEIIFSKVFLREIYAEYYKAFNVRCQSLGLVNILEIGSGAGFIKKINPDVITSDVLLVSGTDLCCSADQLPFKDQSLNAIFMFDVFHHIPDVEQLLQEVSRCLAGGGLLYMIEPANTIWARLIYKNFHYEPFETSASWRIEKKGPLTSSNMALPWIVFTRDRKEFERKFPLLELERVSSHTPFRYLISGGMTFRQLLPDIAYPIIRALEYILSPLNGVLGMFQTIEIRKLNQT